MKKKALSTDLRERILMAYDQGEGTREDVAKRYRVSVGMVKKLLQQRKQTGEIGARYHRCGRKPLIVEEHRRQMRVLLGKKPDMTLAELRESLQLECTLPAIHYALAAMDMTYKKRLSGRANKTVQTSPGRGAPGGGGKAASTRRG
jgi:transposase